jgi:hypothetical protein
MRVGDGTPKARLCGILQIGELPPLPGIRRQAFLVYGLGEPVSMALEPAALAKRVLRPLLPRPTIRMIQQTIGVIDYLRSPDRGAGWGPFNGQTARQALFVDIIVKTRPHAIVETGTFLGTTTELMSRTGLPVFTFELNPRNYGFARARFLRRRNVKLLHGDSRMGLRRLFDGALHPLSGRTVFFYLDAHWNDDLPLAEEIDIVFSRCPSAVVMIDDFEVPSDAGYGYDDYGPGKALVAGYIRPAICAHQLRACYPSTASVADYPSTPMAAEGLASSGRLRRGCVVLVKEACHGPVLASIPLLRSLSEVGRDEINFERVENLDAELPISPCARS